MLFDGSPSDAPHMRANSSGDPNIILVYLFIYLYIKYTSAVCRKKMREREMARECGRDTLCVAHQHMHQPNHNIPFV